MAFLPYLPPYPQFYRDVSEAATSTDMGPCPGMHRKRIEQKSVTVRTLSREERDNVGSSHTVLVLLLRSLLLASKLGGGSSPKEDGGTPPFPRQSVIVELETGEVQKQIGNR